MAITATLVHASPNWLRYLIVATVGSGELVDIPSAAAGATPNLRTDSPAGAIHALALVGSYGLVTSLTTTAQARALWLSDDAAALVGPGLATAIAQYTPRTGAPMAVDATRGPADQTTAEIFVTAVAAGAASGYLDVLIPGAIGV